MLGQPSSARSKQTYPSRERFSIRMAMVTITIEKEGMVFIGGNFTTTKLILSNPFQRVHKR